MNYFIISTVVLLIVVILLIFLLIRSKSNLKESQIHIRSLEKLLEDNVSVYNQTLEGLKFIGYVLGYGSIGAYNDRFYRTFRVQKTKGVCIRQINNKGERKTVKGKLAFSLSTSKYLDVDTIGTILVNYANDKANRTKPIKTQILENSKHIKYNK
jgi:hypothetical protein